MALIGNRNRLKVSSIARQGVYLDADELGTILLPNRYVPEGLDVDDWVEVFIYHDSEDRLIATTQTPKAMVDDCAYLKVVAVNNVGAFLDWGLAKDLLVPYNEQERPMEEGKSYVVYVYFDEETQRIAASTRLRDFLYEESHDFVPGQEVDLLICNRTDLGYKAVINETYLGLLFKDEVFKPIRIGEKMKGLIKNIREDGHIDLCFQMQGQEARDELSQRILDDLKASGGVSRITDKSAPELITKKFNVSKGAYKRAIGALYKQRLITIEKDKITLN
jgi:hypothetical protein